MSVRKLQIALEFMIIFSFVLVLFLFLFALIASQRAQILSGQIFSQEQMIAQSVAVQLDRALQAGNGYSASVPLTGTIGTISYQLVVTKNGAIIVNATVGKQAIQAITYSSVKNVVSSPAYLQPNTLYYNLPIGNGTIYLQNSFGTICIDYSCPTSTNVASNVSLSSQVVHVANMNNGGSVVVSNSPTLTPPSVTVTLWVHPNGPINTGANNYQELIAKSTWWGPYSILMEQTRTLAFSGSPNSASPERVGTSITLSYGNWYFVAMTCGSNGLIGYVGANSVASNPAACTTGNGSFSLYIGNDNQSNTHYFNGSIANVQLYSTQLSAAQLNQLYMNGIAGSPLSSNLIGWWPLNGNANDYSGNGNSGIIAGPLIFPVAAQLFAKVVNQTGQPVANDLVGFTTTLGNFTKSSSFSNYTNANGIASAFLNQQGVNGQALVEAIAYNGNTALATNLAAWWPMSNGQGNVMSDLSGSNNNGALNGNAYWSMPNYVANFDGATTYINVGNSGTLQSSVFTITAWIYPSGSSLRAMTGTASSGGPEFRIDASNVLWLLKEYVVGIGSSIAAVPNNAWSFVAVTYDASGKYVFYINGANAGSGTNLQTFSWSSLIIGLGIAEFFSGSMANLQMYNSVLSASQINALYQSGIGGLPISSSLVGWWPLDGNASDESGSGNNGTIYNNLNFVSTSSIPNTNSNATGVLTGNFNGASSYISINSAFTLGPNYTTATWIYPTSYLSSSSQLSEWLQQSGGVIQDEQFTGGSGKFMIGMYVSGTYHTYDSGSLLVPLNRWSQVVSSLSGNVLTLCLNGICNSQTIASGTVGTSSGSICIGSFTCSPTYDFNGLISNVQIYTTALSSQRVQQLYQQGLSGLPFSGNLIGWWPLNGNANDYSRKGNNGTATNLVYVQQQLIPPYLLSSLGGYGVNLDGQSGYMIGNVNAFQANSFTVSMWAYPTVQNAGHYQLFLGSGTSGTPDNALLLGTNINTGNSNYYFAFWGDDVYNNGNVFVPNKWYYLTATWDKNSGKQCLYLNGVLNVPCRTSTGALNTRTTQFCVGGSTPTGAGCWGSNSYFDGGVANLQIYNTALSATQVRQMYQNAMPPSASVTIPLSWFP